MQDAMIFSFMLLNLANRDVLYNLCAIQGYVQGALQKNQLIASFAEHFKGKP